MKWLLIVFIKLLNPNIRFIVGILRFVAIYVIHKASFRPDSDKRQLSFVQTQILSSRFRRKTAPFVHTQRKDSFPLSRLRQKTASFHPDSRRKTTYFCPDWDERQLSFVQTQTKDSFRLSRLRRKTTSFHPDSDQRQTQTKDSFRKIKTGSHGVNRKVWWVWWWFSRHMPIDKWFWLFRRHICLYRSDSDYLEGMYACM